MKKMVLEGGGLRPEMGRGLRRKNISVVFIVEVLAGSLETLEKFY